MFGFIQKLYAQVYINIVIESKYMDVVVYVEKFSGKNEKLSERFTVEKGELPKEAVKFIEKQERRSPFSYVSVLNLSERQGARSGCNGEGLPNHLWLCANDSKKASWSIYVDTDVITKVKKQFEKTGLDFLFSPFSLLSTHFKEIKSPDAKMYIVVLEEHLSIAVFKQKQLVFAKQVSLKPDDAFALDDPSLLMVEDDLGDELEDDLDLGVEMDVDTLDVEDAGADLDELDDLEELDSLDDGTDFDEIDGLDDIDELNEDAELEEFTDEAEEEAIIEEELIEEDEELSISGLNYNRYEAIKETIHEYYEQTDIQTEFIENVFIADPQDNSEGLVEFLKDELYVEATISKFDLFQAMLVLAKSERKNAS